MRDSAVECLHTDAARSRLAHADPCSRLALTDSGAANTLHHPLAFTNSDTHPVSNTDGSPDA
jgi:hypothetical protein